MSIRRPASAYRIAAGSDAAGCQFNIDFHIYVRRIGKYGDWDDEDVALAVKPPITLKREVLDMQNILQDNPDGLRDDAQELGLTGELIDYHATYRPVPAADAIYDVIAISIAVAGLLALNNSLTGEAAAIIAGAMGYAFAKQDGSKSTGEDGPDKKHPKSKADVT